jgi:hypothetical protein
MTVHQCPKCELRFSWITELDDHCREDHPEFKHDYPVGKPSPPRAPDQPSAEPSAHPETAPSA